MRYADGQNLSGVGSALRADPRFDRSPKSAQSFGHTSRAQEAGLGLGERGGALGVRGVGRGCRIRPGRWGAEQHDQSDRTRGGAH